MKGMNWKTWAGTATFWRTLPNSSLFIFFAAVFCLFGSLGFILDSRTPQETSMTALTINVVIRSFFGVSWAFLGIRRMFKSMIPLAAVQVLVLWLLVHAYSRRPNLAMDAAALHRKLTVDTVGTMISVFGGYVLFLLFFEREGKHFFATHTEIQLASEIHRSLVPDLSFETDEFEFFGASFPSGSVGGDLVDVITENGRWFAYVADVSGHGVPAGVLMSMTKSAVRMWLACRAYGPRLLSDMNSVLKPLLTANRFITFAYAAFDGGPDLALSSAGHVPLLHYRASTQTIEQCSVLNLPLGILSDQSFGTSALRFECGDMLVIVSDGFTETSDTDGREFGMSGVEEVFKYARDRGLRGIAEELTARTRAHGEQKDDQTILLIRRLAATPSSFANHSSSPENSQTT